MKRAFTMIELIFVIVILGILAVVAISKLSVTRDDAEASGAAANVAIAVMDIASYYTAKGEFGSINAMSNTIIDSDGKMKIKNIECFQFSVGNATSSEIDPAKGIALGSPILKILPITSSDNACRSAQTIAKKILDSSPINVGQGKIRFN